MARLHRRAMSGAYGLPAPGLSLDFIGSFASSMSRLTFTRASSASYFDSAGAMQIASTNVPRFDTNPVTLVARGLLIEEARTNLLLNSASLATQNCTVAATAYTLSFYGTGTITLSGVSTAGPLTGSGAYPTRSTLTFTPTAGTLTLTVTGTVEYANLEPGSFATSWIQTTGATATRAADVCSALTSSFAFNAATGTIVVRADGVDTASAASAACVVSFDDGSTNNRFQLRKGTLNRQSGLVVAGGVVQAGLNSANDAWPGTTAQALAMAYAVNDVAVYAQGAVVGTQSSATMPTGITTVTLGSGQGCVPINGHLRSLSYYPSRLSNGQLQALTAA